MKFIEIVALLLLITTFGGKVSAQGKYEKDSIDCATNLNLYQAEYKSKNYKAALPYWRVAVKHCPPAASHTIYVDGISMMRDLIGETTEPVLKQARIDTLLMLYDRRMENFKENKSDVIYHKAVDYERYHPEDTKGVYEYYLLAVNTDRLHCDLHAAAKAMSIAKSMFNNGTLTVDQFTNAYAILSQVAEDQIKEDPDNTVRAAYKKDIESAFMSTSAANCDNLIKVFGQRFHDNKNNIEVVRTVVDQLNARECTQNELYYEAVEAYSKLDPSSVASYGLAKMYHSKGDKEKSMEYLKLAVGTEPDNVSKSRYYQEFGDLFMKEGDIQQAVSYAKQAIAANPRNGKAYLLLGTAYAAVKNCGNDDISKRSVFWVAVDQFMKAKQMDASLADDANKSIELYSQYFPTQADAFYLDILDGQNYTVSCGVINERTIVRTRK